MHHLLSGIDTKLSHHSITLPFLLCHIRHMEQNQNIVSIAEVRGRSPACLHEHLYVLPVFISPSTKLICLD